MSWSAPVAMDHCACARASAKRGVAGALPGSLSTIFPDTLRSAATGAGTGCGVAGASVPSLPRASDKATLARTEADSVDER